MKKSIRIIIISLLILIISIISYRISTIRPVETHPFMKRAHPLNIAHRGGKALFPENTLYAFEHAVALSVDVLEFDVRPTVDNHIVVIHDATVDRTSNGSGRVDQLTLVELKGLDFAYHFIPPDANEPELRGTGITIPTLTEVFDRFPNYLFNIEIKPDSIEFARHVVKLIQQRKMTEQVLLGSFHEHVMQALRSEFPGIAYIATRDEIRTLITLNKIGLTWLHNPKATAYEVPARRKNIEIVTPEFMKAAHKLNQKVVVWTINDSTEMHRLLKLGIDGIVTDRPDIFARVLKQYNLHEN